MLTIRNNELVIKLNERSLFKYKTRSIVRIEESTS
jgi:hypothetical protein